MSEAEVDIETTPDGKQLLSQLGALLELQIQSAQRNDFLAVTMAGQKADDIVNKIARSKLLEEERYKSQGLRLEKLYRKLSIIICAEKKSTADQLKQVRSVGRLLRAYKGGVLNAKENV